MNPIDAQPGPDRDDQRLLAWLSGDRQVPPVPAPAVRAKPPRRRKLPRRWPLLVIGSSASVAIWSGWVGLGALCGFGYVHPLPGIIDSFHLDTAITLPVGVEAYGAYAIGVWLSPDTPVPARKFAGWSVAGSLLLGMLGQVASHLLAAHGYHRAPAWVIVCVSCMPVVALGFAAALTHLMHLPAGAVAPAAVPKADTAVPEPPAELNGHAAAAAELFAADVAAGRLPGIRKIRKGLQVGQPKAQLIRAYLSDLASMNGSAPDA